MRAQNFRAMTDESRGYTSRVLVTGATGFIGHGLCAHLAGLGHEVVAMTRRLAVGPWATTVTADLGPASIDPALLEGVDTIFHLAGKAHVIARTEAEIREYETVHVLGTRALLSAARQAGVRCCVLLGSVKAMGEGGAEVWDEDTPCQPQTAYGRTKLAAERIVLEELPLPCSVVLRPTLVYGRGSKGNLAQLIRAARRGFLPAISFPPNARSMVHVEDLIQACILAAGRPEANGRTYIVTDGREYATNDIMAWIFEALDRKPVARIPFSGLRGVAAVGDMLETFGLPAPLTRDKLNKLAGSARYSNTRICRELGFSPQWSLRDGIRDMVDAGGRTP
ncbi:MAG: NAD-dependent epimerase/dehydratase family protein [Opitutae bacterium]|nr:NAD-dependent epimerase/dehydratase family protein [Opitutae bacterium]